MMMLILTLYVLLAVCAVFVYWALNSVDDLRRRRDNLLAAGVELQIKLDLAAVEVALIRQYVEQEGRFPDSRVLLPLLKGLEKLVGHCDVPQKKPESIAPEEPVAGAIVEDADAEPIDVLPEEFFLPPG